MWIVTLTSVAMTTTPVAETAQGIGHVAPTGMLYAVLNITFAAEAGTIALLQAAKPMPWKGSWGWFRKEKD